MILAWLWLAVVTVVTTVAMTRRLSRPAHRSESGLWDDDDGEGGDVARRLVVLRPCTGNDAFLARSLVTWPQHAEDAVLRFLVPAPSDEVYATAERAAQELRRKGVDAEVTITGSVTGATNRKVAQLAAVDLDAYDIICVLDADLDLHTLDLGALMRPLEHAAAVWLPPTESEMATLGDCASTAVLAGSLHAFPLLAGIDPHGLVGKAFAVRTDALQVVGGFEAFGSRLGEDVEMARRLRLAGYDVVPACGFVRSMARGRTWGATVERLARWLMVIRAQRATLLLSYPALFFASLPLVVCFACMGSIAGMCATISVRLVTAIAAVRLSGAPARVVGHALLADLTLCAAWLRALTTRKVSWRGARLQLDARGHLVEL